MERIESRMSEIERKAALAYLISLVEEDKFASAMAVLETMMYCRKRPKEILS